MISGTSESRSVSLIVAEIPTLKPPVRSTPAGARQVGDIQAELQAEKELLGGDFVPGDLADDGRLGHGQHRDRAQ